MLSALKNAHGACDAAGAFAHGGLSPLGHGLDPRYADDQGLNYLCKNYTRPTPLPCPRLDAAKGVWRPRWGKGFVIFAWWPPVPADYESYAAAGFNMALSGAACAVHCARGTETHGPAWAPTHDELLDVIVDASAKLDALGVRTVFETENGCNLQLGGPGATTVAYGNRTGGIIEARTNITSKPSDGSNSDEIKEGQRVYSKGQTTPELEYIYGELARRNVSHRFAGIFLHDDTEVQTGRTIAAAAWLRANAPDFVPIVNQVSGNSGPQTLYRSGLFIASPEQYHIACRDGSCAATNATAGAMAQETAYKGNALVDSRFALHHWPLFLVGAGNGPLHNASAPNPDAGRSNVRSDSLFRWMAYAAVAYGAKGLNYYCWGGGVWWIHQNSSLPGEPTPMYETVREINADLQAWGDLLLGADFSFVGAWSTGWMQEGDQPPAPSGLVTRMDGALLATAFLQLDAAHGAAGAAYLMVVDKRVSSELAMVAPRNVSLRLHPSVRTAELVAPGQPKGRRGVGSAPRKLSPAAPFSSVARDAAGALSVTFEIVGGGGAMLALGAGDGAAATLRAACFGAADRWQFKPGQASLLDGAGLKAPAWAYDTWHPQYRPYENLEITAGQGFEDGEQTAFVIGGSMATATALGGPAASAGLSGPAEAQAWAWAGFNVLALPAPSADDLAAFGPASRALGDLLDWGYAYGFFGVVASGAALGSALTAEQVVELHQAFRCHGRWGGLVLARGACTDAELAATAAAAKALRTVARGNWVLPLASACSAAAALKLGAAGVPLAMPRVAADGASTAVATAQAAAAQYAPMLGMLARSWSPRRVGNHTEWSNAEAPMSFAVTVDACSTDSDSLLRFVAFASLAYGARGVFWDGARACAGVGTARFTLLSSINRRMAQWGNTFVSEAPGAHGYNISRLWSTGYALDGASPPAQGGLVEAMDDDLLVAELGSLGRAATRLLYVVDKRVSREAGGAPVRQASVTLHPLVTATQPLEGDCAATACQCGMSNLGHVLTLRLAGGSAQLVALSTR